MLSMAQNQHTSWVLELASTLNVANPDKFNQPTSMYDKMPEKDTSIPFTTYGSSMYFLPLNKT